MFMRRGKTTQRTTVELDMQRVRRVQKMLGTKTMRETIDKALHEVERHEVLRRGADAIRKGGLNIVRPEDLPELRRVRR
jgi:Arc/MetJ family transcription regulator